MAKILVADDEQKSGKSSGNTQNLTVTKLPRPQMA
mgnify:CR=1 FL=1